MEGQIIPAGSVQKLLCVSSGGNPLATLTWYKNDKRVSSLWGVQGDVVRVYFWLREVFAFGLQQRSVQCAVCKKAGWGKAVGGAQAGGGYQQQTVQTTWRAKQ